VENAIDAHEKVLMSCVIGVPDPYRMQKINAFAVLRPSILPTPSLKEEVFVHCEKLVVKYAMPYDIEFCSKLPKTLVGKVAYTVLEKEELQKQAVAARKALLAREKCLFNKGDSLEMAAGRSFLRRLALALGAGFSGDSAGISARNPAARTFFIFHQNDLTLLVRLPIIEKHELPM
jgi:hypothetical protein